MSLQTKIAVIGAGHAGVEAALAGARLGVDTTLFTISLDSIANMPCNPSIGGTAKGHLVFEIDALGGEMGRAADEVTLQSRTLNLGKGAAVHSKRIQADRKKYQSIIPYMITNCKCYGNFSSFLINTLCARQSCICRPRQYRISRL